MTRHISEDLLFRMAAEPVTDAGQRQVRLAQLARTLHKLYETTEQDIELFRTLQHTRIRLDAWLDDPQRIDMTAIRPFDPTVQIAIGYIDTNWSCSPVTAVNPSHPYRVSAGREHSSNWSN